MVFLYNVKLFQFFTGVARRRPIVPVADYAPACMVNGAVNQVRPNKICPQAPRVAPPQGNIVHSNIPIVANGKAYQSICVWARTTER